MIRSRLPSRVRQIGHLEYSFGPAALFAATSANAQIFGEEYGSDLDAERFGSGLGETGLYNAWDADDDAGLTEGEFASGTYADWDADNDLQIDEEEFGVGAERWYGADHETGFVDHDVDQSGYIDQEEFGAAWGSGWFGEWATDEDSLVSENEFGSGLYGAADYDQNQVLTIEKEGWFEGRFDGMTSRRRSRRSVTSCKGRATLSYTLALASCRAAAEETLSSATAPRTPPSGNARPLLPRAEPGVR